jgi:hypothetical protein
MTNLKRLGAAMVLTLGLTIAAHADCPVPGVMEGPPCASAAPTIPDDPITPGQTDGPPAASASAEVVDTVSVAEIVLNALMLF